MNRIAQFSLAGIVISILAVVLLFIVTSDNDLTAKPKSFSELGGDFSLTSKDGSVALADFRGKVVVMYFGFLTCPEVCPNSMTVMSTALNRLTEDELNTTQALLVSVDPKRDTPEKLKEYTEFYHAQLLGLTGSKEQIDRVTRQYGAYYDFTEIENVTADYGVEHSSRYYVIDQNGKLVTAMRHSTTPNELYAQIRELLAKVN